MIFFRPRGALGGGPNSPAKPPAFMWSMPGPLASPEMMFTEGAPPKRFWMLEVGVVGVRASEVLWLSGRDVGARPVEVAAATTLAITLLYPSVLSCFACPRF